ncbi:MAG: hypothetical protein RQ752_05275 [Thermohalobaculum sp.]|nr:hypothetical protein [Thermohalobaculum sp.]
MIFRNIPAYSREPRRYPVPRFLTWEDDMVGSENRTRTSAAAPGRDATLPDGRRVTAETMISRGHPSCDALRWIEERRAGRVARPAARLPACVKT